MTTRYYPPPVELPAGASQAAHQLAALRWHRQAANPPGVTDPAAAERRALDAERAAAGLPPLPDAGR